MIIWSTAHFVSTLSIFQLYIDFPFQFGVFTVKSPSVTQRSVSQENAYKKSQNPSPFLHKTIGSDNSFTLIENNFRFLRYLSLNSREQYTMAYGLKACSCHPLILFYFFFQCKEILVMVTFCIIITSTSLINMFLLYLRKEEII